MQAGPTSLQEKTKCKIFHILTFFALFLALLYSIFRAYRLSMSHDESLNYLFFVRYTKSFLDVLTYKIPTTNNHLLNSLFMRVSTHLFGESELTIRLPNLIGHVLFLAGSYKILRLFLRGASLFIGILLVIFQPFPLDYFSCARGYGLGLGFVSLGLYFLLKTVLADKNRAFSAFISLFMLSFAVFSNLSFLNLWLTFAFIILANELRHLIRIKKTRDVLNTLFLSIAPNFLLLWAVYAKPIAKLKEANEFYHGGTTGFWNDSVGSLITSWLYGRHYFANVQQFILLLVLLILVITVFTIYVQWRKKQKNETSSLLTIFAFILLVTGSLIWLQHALFGVVFPHDRAVIYFIPIFFMLVLALWKNLQEAQIPLANLFRKIVVACGLIFLLHSLSTLNLTHFYANKPDAHTKDAVMTMAKLTEGKNNPPNSLKIGVQWWFEPAVNYYLLHNNLKQFARVGREGFEGNYDFYYFREEDKWVIEKMNLKIVKHYKVYPAYLAVPQNSPFVENSDK